MTRPHRPAFKSFLTLLVAWVLALQAVASGAAAGRMLSEAGFRNALLASLCAPGDEGTLPDNGADHELPACCALGCPLAAGSLLPLPAVAEIARPAAAALADDHLLPERSGPKTRPAASPHIPRGPPARA